MPSPEDSEMEGNKVSAYEQEALAKRKNGAGEPSRRCPNCSTRTVRILPVLPQEKQTWNFRRNRKGESPGLHPFLCRSLPEYEPFAGQCIYPE